MEYDVVIIGSGVAGMTAGIYAARAGKSVLIIEEYSLGGTTASLVDIENYPGFDKISGFELVQNMYNQTLSFDVKYEFNNINSIDFDNNYISIGNDGVNYKALIIASGTSYKKVSSVNEDKFNMKGISYCAVCDGMLFRNKKLAVIVNGMTGNRDIEYLSNITKDITIIDLSDKLQNKNFQVFSNSKVIEFVGNEKLNKVIFESNNDRVELDVDGVFVLLGKETSLDLFKDRIKNDGQFIIADENMHTNIPNVFVAGDVRKKTLRQIVTACADGAVAATEAVQYVSTLDSGRL